MGPDRVTAPMLDPFEDGVGRCPHSAFATLRDNAGVHRVPNRDVYLVVRHAECVAVLSDVEAFSNDHELLSLHHGDLIGWTPPAEYEDVAAIRAAALPNLETLHFLDPPVHTEQRRRISRWFTSRRSEASWGPIVDALVTDLIDGFVADGRADLMARFAVPLPIRAIASILGVPYDRESELKAWSDAFVAGMGWRLSHGEWRAKAQAQVDMQRFFMEEIERRLAEPSDDLLGELVAAARPDPDGPPRRSGPDEEFTILGVLNAVQHLLAAGNETTTQAIGLMIRLLVERPHRLARLRDDPELGPVVIEESLRCEPPVLGMWRYCRRARDVGGVHIPEGALVAVMFGAANRDPAVFVDPDELRSDRDGAGRHLAFGHGIHYCVGAGLARLEMQVALHQLVARLPNLRLAPTNTVEHGQSFMLRRLERLDVEWDAP
jgi:cytochrome P450